MTIFLDEATHIYTRDDGLIIPNVSSALTPAYFEAFRFVRQEDLIRARELGKKVHKTIDAYEKGILVRASLHPFLEAHLVQYLKFKREMDFEYISGEQIVWSDKYGFCGTFDIYGLLGGDPFMPDLKTGAKYEAHRLQTAAYKLCAAEREVVPPGVRRGSLYLNPNEYEVTFHTRDQQDTVAFLGLLSYLKWNKDNERHHRPTTR